MIKVKWEGKILPRLYDVVNPARLIFKHSEFFVKLDHRPGETWATRQTMRELDFWDTLVEDRQHFAEILDRGCTPLGKLWHKQKRYHPDKTATQENLLTIVSLDMKYDLYDLTMNEAPPYFDEHSNWMVSGGEVIVYDWGGFRT